ncbi:hypothetical protein [uncultured Kiloniella sp.]|uniref:hypothetical protein n=1 Tax=uncultured Kiloniella sp. TaxID=1133091 RepID=UPI0026111CA3|nr:hypothetical protein [uncultured Kiloniella sp.]
MNKTLINIILSEKIWDIVWTVPNNLPKAQRERLVEASEWLEEAFSLANSIKSCTAHNAAEALAREDAKQMVADLIEEYEKLLQADHLKSEFKIKKYIAGEMGEEIFNSENSFPIKYLFISISKVPELVDLTC